MLDALYFRGLFQEVKKQPSPGAAPAEHSGTEVEFCSHKAAMRTSYQLSIVSSRSYQKY